VKTVVKSLVVSETDIFAGTNNYGVWRRSFSDLTGVPAIDPQNAQVRPDRLKVLSAVSGRNLATIEFTLPQPEQVIIDVFLISGRKIVSLANRCFNAGTHRVAWDTFKVVPGFYTVRIQTGLKSSMTSVPIVR
jgi:hypothetical protein